jgi:hypothetical protein
VLKGKALLAYTAGIVDGEGCISINRNKGSKKHKYTFRLYVIVTNTNPWLCQFLKMQFGGSIYEVRANRDRRHALCYNWTLATEAASKFLELILPYLTIKKPQAELAIKYQHSKININPLTDEQYILQEADYILMHNLKAGGKSHAC